MLGRADESLSNKYSGNVFNMPVCKVALLCSFGQYHYSTTIMNNCLQFQAFKKEELIWMYLIIKD